MRTMVALCTAVTVVLSHNAMSQERSELLTFEKRCESVGELEDKLRTTPSNEEVSAQECLNAFDRLNVHQGELGGDFFSYYRARLLMKAGRWEDAVPIFADLSGSSSLAPEATLGLAVVFEQGGHFHPSREIDRLCRSELARLVPASDYFQASLVPVDADAQDSREFRIPGTTSKKDELLGIGTRYAQMGMWSHAAGVYKEALYAGIFPCFSFSITSEEESWASVASAAYWVQVAMAEWQLRDAGDASNHIAKAFVFGGTRERQRAREFIKSIAHREPPENPPRPKGEKLLEIADIYAKMEMHPRAIELLRDHSDLLGDTGRKLLTSLEDKWVSLVQKYCDEQDEGGCTLFGQRVEQKTDILSISIAYPSDPLHCRESYRRIHRYLADMLSADDVAGDDVGNMLASVERQCMRLRGIHQKLVVSSRARAKSSIQEAADEARQQIDALGIRPSDFVKYYRARLLIAAGRYDDGASLLCELVPNPCLAPEALYSLHELVKSGLLHVDKTGEPDDWMSPLQKLIVKVLPMSMTSAIANSVLDAERGKMEVILPDLSCDYDERSDRMKCPIGDLFFRMRMWTEGISAYREAIHFDGPDLLLPEKVDHDRFGLQFSTSRIYAPFWLKLAEAEWHLRDIEAAGQYISKAILFGNESAKFGALMLLEKMRNPEAKQDVEPQPEALQTKQICQLYVERKMHPRALLLLEQYRGIIGAGEADRLGNEYKKAWTELIKPYFADKEKRMLFGQVVSVAEIGTMKVRPPCQTEALEEAAATVKELLRKK